MGVTSWAHSWQSRSLSGWLLYWLGQEAHWAPLYNWISHHSWGEMCSVSNDEPEKGVNDEIEVALF